MCFRILVAISSITFSLTTSLAQQDGTLGSWNFVNLKKDINERLSLFGEAQLRSLRFYDHFHYYEFKGGVQYQLTPELLLAMAGGRYVTYAEGGDFVTPKNNDEIRIWPMIILRQQIFRFHIEQRYRIEMRYTSFGYRNRFRYRFGLFYPFSFSSGSEKKWSAGITNELFFTDNTPYFERNRASFQLNYRVQSNYTLHLGYIHQLDYRINDETGRDFLVVGMLLNLGKGRSNTSSD